MQKEPRPKNATNKSEDTKHNMNEYDDIIHLPHYELRHHQRMPREARAAQFAPFAALTGYEKQITEAEEINSQKYEDKNKDIKYSNYYDEDF